jgi:hypothetical protein
VIGLFKAAGIPQEGQCRVLEHVEMWVAWLARQRLLEPLSYALKLGYATQYCGKQDTYTAMGEIVKSVS